MFRERYRHAFPQNLSTMVDNPTGKLLVCHVDTGSHRGGRAGRTLAHRFVPTAARGVLTLFSLSRPFVLRRCRPVYSTGRSPAAFIAPDHDRSRNPPWPRASVPISRTTAGGPGGTASACACARARGGRSSLHAAAKGGPASPPPTTRVRSREVRACPRSGNPLREPGGTVARARLRRFAVVAARRVGGAVHRNRARRILREAWRQVWPQVKGISTRSWWLKRPSGAPRHTTWWRDDRLLPPRGPNDRGSSSSGAPERPPRGPDRRRSACTVRPYRGGSAGIAASIPPAPATRRTRSAPTAPQGIALATWRVLRCNPYGEGGVDQVPASRRCADRV